VLSNTIKQKRKEKAGKWEVPLPKVRQAVQAHSPADCYLVGSVFRPGVPLQTLHRSQVLQFASAQAVELGKRTDALLDPRPSTL
jgi:hypothetical protein